MANASDFDSDIRGFDSHLGCHCMEGANEYLSHITMNRTHCSNPYRPFRAYDYKTVTIAVTIRKDDEID